MIKLYPTITVSENKQGGFTLIEIILTLVIAAVVGAGLVQYLGTSFTKSSVPIQRLRQTLELQQVMENITADYIKNVKDEDDLAGLQSNIGTEGSNKNNSYGQYTVIYNRFIKFDGSPPIEFTPPDQNNLLKVTIKYGSGDILTTLFSSEE